MTPLQRIERAQKVLLWRDRENCTWKWIGKMIGKPPGACKAMYTMAVSVRTMVVGSRNDYDVVSAVRRWLNRHYNAAGKITDKRQWVWHSQVKELAEMIGAKTFKVNGRIYVDWKDNRETQKMVPVLRWEQTTVEML